MWWLLKNGKTLGPYSDGEMRSRIAGNLVAPLDRVSNDGATWRFVRDVRIAEADAVGRQSGAGRVVSRPVGDGGVSVPNPPSRPQGTAPAMGGAPVAKKDAVGKAGLIAAAVAAAFCCIWAFATCDSVPKADSGEHSAAESASSENGSDGTPDVSGGQDGETGGGETGGAASGAMSAGAGTDAEAPGKGSEGSSSGEGGAPMGEPDPAAGGGSKTGGGREDGAAASDGGTGRGSRLERMEKSVVIVESGETRGTAFLLEDGGKVYLVSAESVFRGWDSPVIRHPDGSMARLSLGGFSVADGRNLARFEVSSASAPLALAGRPPALKASVVVCGCDGAGGGLEKSPGVVCDVSGDVFGIAAQVRKGTVGGPVVDGNGEALGAVVAVGSAEDPHSTVVSLAAAKWVAVDRAAYERQVGLLVRLGKYHAFLEPFLLFEKGGVDGESLMYDSQVDGRVFGKDEYGFNGALAEVADAFERLDELACPEEGEPDPSRMRDAYSAFTAKRLSALLLANSFLGEGTWNAAPHLLKGASIAGANGGDAGNWLEIVARERIALGKVKVGIERNFNMDELVRLIETE